MNRTEYNMSVDLQIERLVDGELDERSRRQLLEQLDKQPDGWRHCALAFLESQCWKESLGGLTAAATERSAALQYKMSPLPTASSRRSSALRRSGMILAMAASFLTAFWIGSHYEHWRLAPPTEVAGSGGDVAQVAEPSTRPNPSAVTRFTPTSDPWHIVTVSSPADATDTLRLPARECAKLDRWLQELPPPVPADVLRAFNRTGHQVQQRRELVPVPLQDGRRMVVPVDQVDVHYVGNTTY